MEELIYLLVKLIARAMSNSGSKASRQPTPAEIAWQQRLWEQQRLMQQAALPAPRGRQPVAPPPPPPRPAPARQPLFSVSTPTDEGRISLKDAGGGMRPDALTKLIDPDNLRRRFILTEILRPPVSLRTPRM